MTVLNYQVHYNPTSHKDVLSKFRSFAIAQGWTSDTYETNVDWAWDSGNSKYDWLAGNTDFLQLYSNGYGTHDLIFRFHWEGTGVDGNSEWTWLTGIDPAKRWPNDQLFTKPYDQDDYMGSRMKRFSLPPGAHVALWLFGNDKYLIAVDQVSSTMVLMWHVGTFDLFDPNMSTVSFCRSSFIYTSGATVWPWYDAPDAQAAFVSPWDNWAGAGGYYEQCWFDGRKVGGTSLQPNAAFFYTDVIKSDVAFNSLSRAVRLNTFTGKRVLIKQTWFGERQDGVYMPVATSPFYKTVFTGLQIGDNIKYGAEEYLVFPNTFSHKKYGTAFRIV